MAVPDARFVFIALMVSIASLLFETSTIRISSTQFMEIGLKGVFGFFQVAILSLSNSYIEAKQCLVMFMMYKRQENRY
jgi:hypothetical protein